MAKQSVRYPPDPALVPYHVDSGKRVVFLSGGEVVSVWWRSEALRNACSSLLPLRRDVANEKVCSGRDGSTSSRRNRRRNRRW